MKATKSSSEQEIEARLVNANGLPFDADRDGLPDVFENWHGTGHQKTSESDWQNANTQPNGLNDLQVWELSSTIQVNDPWQDAGTPGM